MTAADNGRHSGLVDTWPSTVARCCRYRAPHRPCHIHSTTATAFVRSTAHSICSTPKDAQHRRRASPCGKKHCLGRHLAVLFASRATRSRREPDAQPPCRCTPKSASKHGSWPPHVHSRVPSTRHNRARCGRGRTGRATTRASAHMHWRADRRQQSADSRR